MTLTLFSVILTKIVRILCIYTYAKAALEIFSSGLLNCVSVDPCERKDYTQGSEYQGNKRWFY